LLLFAVLDCGFSALICRLGVLQTKNARIFWVPEDPWMRWRKTQFCTRCTSYFCWFLVSPIESEISESEIRFLSNWQPRLHYLL
jgi:hypothetical protein